MERCAVLEGAVCFVWDLADGYGGHGVPRWSDDITFG
jgi:hypothetical protein